MAIDKVFYNQSSASNLGWNPTWFGEQYFDDDLVKAIRKWQKDYGIVADGLCGPGTYRRIWTERQADIDDYKPFGERIENLLSLLITGMFVFQLSHVREYSIIGVSQFISVSTMMEQSINC